MPSMKHIPIGGVIGRIFGHHKHDHDHHHGHEHGEGEKIQQGHKYARLLKKSALNKDQKKILKKYMKAVKSEKFHKPRLFEQARHFMRGAVEEGPPESPLEGSASDYIKGLLENGIEPSAIEGAGTDFLTEAMQHGAEPSPIEGMAQTYLQNLLGRSPEEQYSTFAQPYMRQFQEEIMPEVAERFAGAGALSGSGFQNAISHAGAGLAENLASLKGNLINQMLDRQLQGANVGLGYAQMPMQRFGQRLQAANTGLGYAQLPMQRTGMMLQAANTGVPYAQMPTQRFNQQFNYAQAAIPTSLIPQQMQQENNRYANQLNFARQQQVLGTPTTNTMLIPPQTRDQRGGFWRGAGPGLAGAGAGAGIGALLGGPAGALMGAGIGSSLGNSLRGGGATGFSLPIGLSPVSASSNPMSTSPIRSQMFSPENNL